MAKTKKPYAVFETEAEFSMQIDKAYENGRIKGFKDGSVWTASYFYELMQDMFKADAFRIMQEEINHRHIEEWRRTHEDRSLKWELDNREKTKEEIKELEKEVLGES